jgi:hypothetical protein
MSDKTKPTFTMEAYFHEKLIGDRNGKPFKDINRIGEKLLGYRTDRVVLTIELETVESIQNLIDNLDQLKNNLRVIQPNFAP